MVLSSFEVSSGEVFLWLALGTANSKGIAKIDPQNSHIKTLKDVKSHASG
jgi:hypothetical protein